MSGSSTSPVCLPSKSSHARLQLRGPNSVFRIFWQRTRLPFWSRASYRRPQYARGGPLQLLARATGHASRGARSLPSMAYREEAGVTFSSDSQTVADLCQQCRCS